MKIQNQNHTFLLPWDGLWTAFAPPFTKLKRIQKFGPIYFFRMGKRYGANPIASVGAYLLPHHFCIDTGPSCFGRELLFLLRKFRIHHILLTHHHEDHSGNMAFLQSHGFSVYAPQATWEILKGDFPLPFYRHLAWGKPGRVRKTGYVLGDELEINHYKCQVIPTPGHSQDHVSFYFPQEGWLFSGDIYIHHRIKMFMKDEDFYLSKKSIERLLELDFDPLFCQHNPRPVRGKEALKKKLEWFQELEEKVETLAQKGWNPKRIALHLFDCKAYGMKYLTGGETSSENLVRAILKGQEKKFSEE
ncbi:MAG: MBL fold metallo-hydrolase [Planctomycetota bacterium]|nr:MAG: MBL fold metallo-hydrolase [Planctomycetota bacterium]